MIITIRVMTGELLQYEEPHDVTYLVPKLATEFTVHRSQILLTAREDITNCFDLFVRPYPSLIMYNSPYLLEKITESCDIESCVNEDILNYLLKNCAGMDSSEKEKLFGNPHPLVVDALLTVFVDHSEICLNPSERVMDHLETCDSSGLLCIGSLSKNPNPRAHHLILKSLESLDSSSKSLILNQICWPTLGKNARTIEIVHLLRECEQSSWLGYNHFALSKGWKSNWFSCPIAHSAYSELLSPLIERVRAGEVTDKHVIRELIANPNPDAVDFTLEFIQTDYRDPEMWNSLSMNSADRIVEWLLLHPDKIRLPYAFQNSHHAMVKYLCNKFNTEILADPRVLSYATRNTNPDMLLWVMTDPYTPEENLLKMTGRVENNVVSVIIS